METSWHTYPKIYALGHRAVNELFFEDVTIEEKVDGSQFSFGLFEDGIKARSKGKEIVIDAPEKMFSRAIDVIQTLDLRKGWTYRGEYLQKPKHNALCYDRIPENHIIVFDINNGHESYLSYEEKAIEAQRIGLEVVPLIKHGKVDNAELIRELLGRESHLGGPSMEGVVVKNYQRFGFDKKVLMGKFVSEAFKEVHRKEWKGSNPKSKDIIQQIGDAHKTEARWLKAIQHLKEKGEFVVLIAKESYSPNE